MTGTCSMSKYLHRAGHCANLLGMPANPPQPLRSIAPRPTRHNNRAPDALRSLKLSPDWSRHAEGSCLVEWGDTTVLCTASVDDSVPPWLRGKGTGWVTAEYAMLPRATDKRKERDGRRGKADGRSIEIQRLIGRSLRTVVDMGVLGEQSITLDCDVLQADGGTRCASIVGAWVALHRAFHRDPRRIPSAKNPLRAPVAAVSVGLFEGEMLLDLDYREDSRASLDATIVMSEAGKLVELHAGGEGATFERAQVDSMLDLAQLGVDQIIALQQEAAAR
jgi:ribonuclease PH